MASFRAHWSDQYGKEFVVNYEDMSFQIREGEWDSGLSTKFYFTEEIRSDIAKALGII